MESTTVAFLLIASAQSALAVVLALTFWRAWRELGHRFLLLWALAFVALAVYGISSGLANAWPWTVPTSHPVRLLLTGIGLTAAYAQVLWLLSGVLELSWQRQLRLRLHLLTGALIVLLAAAATLAFAFDPTAVAGRLYSRVGIRYAVAGSSFLLAGGALWWFGLQRRGFGPKLLVCAMLLFGVHLLHGLAVLWWQLERGTAPLYASFLGLGDVLAYAVIGLGLVIWLQEEAQAQAQASRNRVAELSYYDPISGLPNRRWFGNWLSDRLSHRSNGMDPIHLVIVELSRFRQARASMPESQFAEVLTQLARRLRETVPEAAAIAQFDAQLFALALEARSGTSSQDLPQLARRVVEVLSQELVIDGRSLYLSAHAGLAQAPRDASTAEPLLKCAESAVDVARSAGEAVRSYSADLGDAAVQRIAFENQLRRAFVEQEFELYLQSVVDARTLAVGGFEALVRWRHPQRGLLKPIEFLPTIEAIGLSRQLDDYMLDQVTTLLSLWTDGPCASAFIAVNLSAQSFRRSDLAAQIGARLQLAGVAPARLQLEVTESTALDDLQLAERVLASLRSCGIAVALDDFGTGYSSLTHLRHLPVRKVKLDQSFIRGVLYDSRDACIVSAIVELAHGMDLEVVAEGVESSEQIEFLRARGVGWLQGYRFSQPEPVSMVEAAMSVARAEQVIAAKFPYAHVADV